MEKAQIVELHARFVWSDPRPVFFHVDPMAFM